MATVLTNTGRSEMIAALNTRLATPYIRWGTGAGTAAVTDTTLFTEVSGGAAATPSIVTTTAANDTYQVVALLTSAAAQTITNTGLFSASSGGNLIMKIDHAGQELGVGDKIEYTLKIQQT